MKVNVNNNEKVIQHLKNINKNNLLQLCENDEDLFNVLNSFLKNGFITTSSSKGHIYDNWKDPIYIAVYVDKFNTCEILNIIQKINGTLDENDKQLIFYTFNYNSVFINNVYDVEYMFGIQINIFEESEQRKRILKCIEQSVENMQCKKEILLDYNFIYVANRFINFSNYNTNWININFNAINLGYGFSFIYKKRQDEKSMIEKEYNFENGIEEFEYLMNY